MEPKKKVKDGRSRNKRPTLYAWERLFKQIRFTLRRGEDYTCSQTAISGQARVWAANNGYKISIVDLNNEAIVVIVRERPFDRKELTKEIPNLPVIVDNDGAISNH